MERKLISFDWAIKRILRSKANFEILEGFLSELLFEDIKILEVLESESNKEQESERLTRLDIKVKNSKGEIILVAIQYSSEINYFQDILHSSSKMVLEYLKDRDLFFKTSKIIFISIPYFDFGSEGDDYIYKGGISFTPQSSQDKFNRDSFIEYYLIKLDNFNNEIKEKLDEWIYFLKNEEIKENFKAKGIDKAKETLDFLKMREEERIRYNRFQKEKHYEASIYKSSYIIGKIEGAKEKQIEIAKKSLKNGLDIETIALITGLSIQEIEKLKN